MKENGFADYDDFLSQSHDRLMRIYCLDKSIDKEFCPEQDSSIYEYRKETIGFMSKLFVTANSLFLERSKLQNCLDNKVKFTMFFYGTIFGVFLYALYLV